MEEKNIREFQNFPLRYAYTYLPQKNLSTECLQIKEAAEKNNIKRARVIKLLKSNDLLNEFIENYWSFGKTEDGLKKILWYEKHLSSKTTLDNNEELETSYEETKFAYEQDLQKYLAKNLTVIEQGLILYEGEEGNEGYEFILDDNKRIDILAKDKEDTFVVIELKVSRGHEKVIGQSLYYRNKIKKRFSVSKVRIIIISREITEELKIATEELPDVELFNYELSVKLRKIIPN